MSIKTTIKTTLSDLKGLGTAIGEWLTGADNADVTWKTHTIPTRAKSLATMLSGKADKNLSNVDNNDLKTKGTNAGLADDILSNVTDADFKVKANSAGVGDGGGSLPQSTKYNTIIACKKADGGFTSTATGDWIGSPSYTGNVNNGTIIDLIGFKIKVIKFVKTRSGNPFTLWESEHGRGHTAEFEFETVTSSDTNVLFKTVFNSITMRPRTGNSRANNSIVFQYKDSSGNWQNISSITLRSGSSYVTGRGNAYEVEATRYRITFAVNNTNESYIGNLKLGMPAKFISPNPFANDYSSTGQVVSMDTTKFHDNNKQLVTSAKPNLEIAVGEIVDLHFTDGSEMQQIVGVAGLIKSIAVPNNHRLDIFRKKP